MDKKDLPKKHISEKKRLKRKIAYVKFESKLKLLRTKKQILLQKIVVKNAVRREKQRANKELKIAEEIINNLKDEMEKMSKEVEEVRAVVRSAEFDKIEERVRDNIKHEEEKEMDRDERSLEMILHQNGLVMELPYMKELRENVEKLDESEKEMRENEEKVWKEYRDKIISWVQVWKKEQSLENEKRPKRKSGNLLDSDSAESVDLPDSLDQQVISIKLQREFKAIFRDSKGVVKPSKRRNRIRRSYEKNDKEAENDRRHSDGSLKRPHESSEEEVWIGKRVRFDMNSSYRSITPESSLSDLSDLSDLFDFKTPDNDANTLMSVSTKPNDKKQSQSTPKVVHQQTSVTSNASMKSPVSQNKPNIVSEQTPVTSNAPTKTILKNPVPQNGSIASSSGCKVDVNTPSTSKSTSPKANVQPSSPKSPVFKVPAIPPPKKGILKQKKPIVIAPQMKKLQEKLVANTPPTTRGQLRRTRSERDLGSALKKREALRAKSPPDPPIEISKKKPALLKPKRVKRFPLKPLEPREPIITRQSSLQRSESNIETNPAENPKTPEKKATNEMKKSPARRALIEKENDIMTRRRERSPSPLADTDSASSDDEMNPKKIFSHDDDFETSFAFDSSNNSRSCEPIDLDCQPKEHLGNTPDFLK